MQGYFSLCFGIPVVQSREVVGLAQGVGADGAQGGGEGLAVLGVALFQVSCGRLGMYLG